MVARGFEEEKNFKTDSPTFSREANRLTLAIIAGMKWKLNSLDVKTAFLQGDQIDRVVYVRPPIEAKTETVWKLNKTVYGLADASRNWYTKLRNELIKLGCIPCKIDQGIFCWFSNKKLIGLMISFVDDILWGGISHFCKIIEKLRKVFSIGVENSTTFKYIGIELDQNDDFSISLSQNSYVEDLNFIELNESKNERPLDGKETTKLRETLGQLNWVACMTRPEISFEVNKLMKFLKTTPNAILIPSINIDKSYIVGFSDASFGKLHNGGSQGGEYYFSLTTI